jgi:hypothetical protein
MEAPKIHLSNAETEMMLSADIILTKNRVLEKIRLLLEEVQEHQLELIKEKDLKANEIFSVPPKISRGENYLGLPWLILDHPRVSRNDELFFIRSMFWWGRFFSSTLHLSGRHKNLCEENVAASYKDLRDHSIGMGDDPWVHHFEANNYRKIGTLTEREFRLRCSETKHLKIAINWPLNPWQEAPSKLFEQWKFLLGIAGQLPRR